MPEGFLCMQMTVMCTLCTGMSLSHQVGKHSYFDDNGSSHDEQPLSKGHE